MSDVIRDDGMWVDVDATGYGILGYAFSWRDLGVELPEGAEEIVVQPGAHALPKLYCGKLQAAAQQARDALYDLAAPMPKSNARLGGTAWRWIPVWNQDVFDLEIEHAQAKLRDAIDLIERDRPVIQAVIERKVGEIARRSRRSLEAAGATLEPDFEEDAVRRAVRRIPTPAQLREMSVDYRVAPEHVARILRGENEPVVQPSNGKTAVDLAAEAKAKMDLAEHREMLREERESRRRQAQLREQATLDFARQELEPVREVVDWVRGRMVDQARSLLKTIEDSGKPSKDGKARAEHLPGASVQKIESMADWFGRFNNVTQDADLAGLVGELRLLAAVPPKGQKRSTASLKVVLQQIVDVTAEQAVEATKTNRMKRLLI